MLQRWTDHEDVEHRVLDDYHRNRVLIDLTAQPDEIKASLDESIAVQTTAAPVGQVGVHFLRFCGKWDLEKLSDKAEIHAAYLNAHY
jgi:hypothetical protein